MKIYQNAINVFISYADEDKWLLQQLHAHLSLLIRQGLISNWYDRQIAPGTDWAMVIDGQLEQASLILLVISSDFLASAYCYQIEMKRALERHEAGEAHVIPIIARPVDWQDALFGKLQVLPSDTRPITSWPSQDEAFLDIARGIRKIIESLVDGKTVKAAELAKPAERSQRFGTLFPAVWNVSRRHTPFFTGREQVLQQLFDRFQVDNNVEIVPPQALTGLGGLGKTQTAAEYAYRFRGKYQAVLWVRANTYENLVTDFRTIARLLRRPEDHLQDRAHLIQTMQEWFKDQTDWLLIFDNADDLALIDPFLPQAARGHLLLTTRARATIAQAHPLTLEALKPEDGALCLLRRAGILAWNQPLRDASSAISLTAQELSVQMGGLPLALEQAGAYINDTECGVKRYLLLYQHYRSELHHLHSGAVPDYPDSVASAWRVSRSIVEQSNPAAADLLRFCAYLAPEAIPDELVTKAAYELGPTLGAIATNPLALDQAIGLLRKYSLLNREADNETNLTRLSIHQIMQEILINEMSEPTRQLWAERTVRAVAQALPTTTWSTLQAHARNCLRLIEQWHMQFPEARYIQQYIQEIQ